MVERMQVDALLYPCATAIEARPGDRLMVVAGVVVGVYTGRGPAAPAALPAPAPKPAVAKEVARPPAAPPRKPAAHREPGRVVADQATVWRSMLDALRANGGELHSTDLRTKLPGYSQGSTVQFDFRKVVRAMTGTGVLEVVAGPGTMRRYILRNDPGGAAPPLGAAA